MITIKFLESLYYASLLNAPSKLCGTAKKKSYIFPSKKIIKIL